MPHCAVFSDAKKQSQMAALSKERDNLQSAIKTYKSLFETTEQLIEELKSKFSSFINSQHSVTFFPLNLTSNIFLDCVIHDSLGY